MTTGQLIFALSTLPLDTEVVVWVNGAPAQNKSELFLSLSHDDITLQLHVNTEA